MPVRRSDIIVNKPSYQFLDNRVENGFNNDLGGARVRAPVVESKVI